MKYFAGPPIMGQRRLGASHLMHLARAHARRAAADIELASYEWDAGRHAIATWLWLSAGESYAAALDYYELAELSRKPYDF